MLLRKTFPRIRSVQVKGQAFYQVDARKQGTDGKRETFANRRDAEKRAADIATELTANGVETLALPLELRVMAMTCARSLSAFGKSIQDATTFYLKHLQQEREKNNSARVAPLADAWYADKSSGKKQQLRKETLLDIRDTANLLKRLFPESKVLDVQRHDLETYLDGLPVSARRRYNRLYRV